MSSYLGTLWWGGDQTLEKGPVDAKKLCTVPGRKLSRRAFRATQTS